MKETIINYLLENYPWIAAIIIVAAIVGYIVWQVAKFKNKYDKDHSRLESLPCSKMKEEIDSISDYSRKIESISEQLSEISRWVMKFDSSEIDALAPKFSPRRMTKAGLDLYEQSGAKTILQDNLDHFLELLKVQDPQTPLDVEDRAYVVLMGDLANPVFDPIKNYIYYQPEKITLHDEEGKDVVVSLSLLLLLRLMSIDLRDAYLEKYPKP